MQLSNITALYTSSGFLFFVYTSQMGFIFILLPEKQSM